MDGVVLDDPLTAAPLAAECDTWCHEISTAYALEAAGDLRGIIDHTAAAYSMEAWADWGWAVVLGETGGTLLAVQPGYYQGWTQQDPAYWPERAAAAGFPGASAYERVPAAATMFSMVRAKILAGYEQPWIDWPNTGRNPYRPY